MGGLCTLADIKTWLDITSTTKDAKLQLFIDRVSSQMIAYLGFPVKFATYTSEVHTVNNNQYLFLNALPIQSVTACTIDGVTVAAGTADDNYQYTPGDALTGRLYRGVGWVGRYFTRNMTYDPVAGARIILISYTAGWYLPDDTLYDKGAFNSLPECISSACMQEVATKYRINMRGAEGLKSYSEGGVSWSWDNKNITGSIGNSGLSDDTVAVLNNYRRYGIA